MTRLEAHKQLNPDGDIKIALVIDAIHDDFERSFESFKTSEFNLYITTLDGRQHQRRQPKNKDKVFTILVN